MSFSSSARRLAAAAFVVSMTVLAPHAFAFDKGGSEADRRGADGVALPDPGDDATPRGARGGGSHEGKEGKYVVEDGSHTGGGPTGGARDMPDARIGQGMGSPPPPEQPAQEQPAENQAPR